MRKLRPLLILLLIPLGSGTTHAQIRGEYQPDANTVLLLHMNETSGSTVTDASSYGNNGTATGTTIVDGRFGKGRSFSGTSDYIRVANNVFDPNFPFTCEAGVNIDQLGTRLTFLSLAGAPGAGGASVGLSVEANGRAQFSLFDGGGHTIFSKDSLELNRWYHIAGVYTTQRMRLYINGILQRDSTHSGGAQTWSNLNVGANAAYNADYFNGLIDEVRISNKARSASEFNLQLPPRNLTATVSGTTISLNWQNGGGTVGLLRYKVYRGLDSTNVSLIDSTAGATFSNTGIAFGTRYFYRVSAVDSTAFEGAKSFAVNATTASGSAVPTITSFSPTSGPIGTSVTITGTNFSPTPANNVVYFGPVRATVNSATSSSLTVTVPSGATYQPISVTVDGLTAHSRAPFIITFSGGGSIANGSFASKVDFTTAFAPYNIAIGDLDGDGKPDLAVTNYSSNTVSVFRNTSVSGVVTNESFSARVDFVTGSSPSGVVITDFDGDGKLDLAVTNSGSNTVSLFRNTSTTGGISNNSFSTKVDFETQAIPLGIATGDLDADGKPDLVVTNTGLHTISVFRNIGVSGSITTNSFEVGLVFFSGSTSGSNPYGVAMSDLDGDGKPDLAVTNQSSSSLSVFRNNSISGSIRFDAKVDFAAGTSPQYVAIGDLDGDGKPDLAITNNQSTTVSVFRNTSTGGSITSSSFSGKVDFTTGGYSFGVGIGDLDGDGKPDLAVTNYVGNSISVFRNTSSSGSITNNSFATKVDFATGSSPWGIAVGDLDGDGKTDLAVANYGSNTISVLRNGLSGLSSAALLGEYTADASTVLLLHMNETSGSTVSDASGQNNHATTAVSATSAGRFGNARVFDGSNNFIFSPVTSVPSSTPYTIEGWIKVNPNWKTFNRWARLFSNGQGWATVLRYNSFGLYLGGGDAVAVSDSFNTDRWYHLATVFASGRIKLYVNGELELDQQFAPTGNRQQFEIGGQTGTNDYLSGIIDEIRISNKARSPDEFNLQLPPRNLTATASGTTINLNWQNGGGAVGLVRYKVYRGLDSANVSLLDSTTSTSYSNSGLVAGTRFFYRISAVDSTGFEGAKSYAVNATTSSGSAVPTITSFAPTSGPIGTSVTITGTNFSTTAANNIVYFGAVRGTVTAAASTSLGVTVPAGATYHPITVTVNGLTGYSRPPFAVTFPGGGSITSSSYASKVDLATGTAPEDVATGDFNADGKLDLAVTAVVGFTTSVYENTSAGVFVSFAEKIDLTGSYGAAIGDLDGDGKLDLAVGSNFDRRVSVYRNTSSSGSISFAPRVEFTTASGASALAIADIDGDGKPDLIVANSGTNTVSILRNITTAGSINFAAKVDFATADGPRGVATGDLDGDGKPEIAITNMGTGGVSTVSIFLNLSLIGSISTASRIDLETGIFPSYVAIGDLDLDGKPDVGITNWGSSTVSVFRNTSSLGSLAFSQKVDFSTGWAPFGVAFGDVDGDSKPDVVVANYGSNTVSVLRNTSTAGSITSGAFATKVDFPAGDSPVGVLIADLDGDGRPELVAANRQSNTFSVFRSLVGDTPPVPSLSSPGNGATNQPTTLTLRWNAVTGATTYQLQVSTSSAFTTTVFDDSTITGTSRQVGPLSNSTTYYWRVNAKNAGGTSGYSGTFSFTTVVAAPAAPTLASPPNSATGVSTNPTLTWSSVSGATSYRLQVSTSSGFSTLVLDQSGVNANSYSLSSLANNTTYYWRVSASSVGGTSAFASTFSFTTIVAAPAAVTVGSPANGATNQPTTLTLSWSGSAGATTYRVQVATDPTLRSLVVHDSLLTTTSRQVGPLAYNTVYYWQVSARNAGGESPFSPSASFTTVASKTISPSTPITFPINPTSSTDYRLISFPGTSSLTVGQVFTSGSQNTDWRIFRENGNALPSNLTELSSSSALAVGEGYWVLQKGTLSFSRSVTMPQVSSDGTYTINVRNGWNVIGNPFDVDVQWSSVLSANSLSGITLSAYNGSQGFQSVTVFEPFKGYYCNVPLTTLKIRYPFPAFNVLPLESPPIDWKLRFALETDINKDEENYIGIALSAKIDLDELDQPKPPLVFDQGFLYFPRATWSDRYSLYNSDFRPGVGEGQVWDFEVSNPRRTRSIIRVLGVESVPPAYEITLVNLHNTAAVDLRKRNEYEFLPVKDKTPFQVIVGKRSYTDQELAKFIPSSFELEQNYPNPFNPTTSIGYKVAKESLVKVEILSLLGQTVAILINARHSPGFYTLVWNASDQGGAKVPSGVYLSRLIVDGKVVQVRKMTLLR